MRTESPDPPFFQVLDGDELTHVGHSVRRCSDNWKERLYTAFDTSCTRNLVDQEQAFVHLVKVALHVERCRRIGSRYQVRAINVLPEIEKPLGGLTQATPFQQAKTYQFSERALEIILSVRSATAITSRCTMLIVDRSAQVSENSSSHPQVPRQRNRARQT